jgi:hypothetical protein
VALDRARQAPQVPLGAGITVDRRYPEPLWQFADYRIPADLFADDAARVAYEAALARGLARGPSRP